MLRNEWKFTYPIDVVLVAIEKRITHHHEQLELIKDSIEQTKHAVDSLADMRSPLHFVHDTQMRMMKKKELLIILGELNEKINIHEKALVDLVRWKKMLSDNSGSVPLDVDDWNYFFGPLVEE